MARMGRGASGGPLGQPRNHPPRQRAWPRPCASWVKQVGSGLATTRAGGGASPKSLLRAARAGGAAGKCGRGGKQGMSWRHVPRFQSLLQDWGPRRGMPAFVAPGPRKCERRLVLEGLQAWGREERERGFSEIASLSSETYTLFRRTSGVGARARTQARESARCLPFLRVQGEWVLRSKPQLHLAPGRGRHCSPGSGDQVRGLTGCREGSCPGAWPPGAARLGMACFKGSPAQRGLLSSLRHVQDIFFV